MDDDNIVGDDEDFDDVTDAPAAKKKKRARKTTIVWSEKMTLELIAEVEGRPNLWNILISGYRNRHYRELSWDEIAAKLRVSKSECMVKWTLLRQQFRVSICFTFVFVWKWNPL